jgi:hypothetical protein
VTGGGPMAAAAAPGVRYLGMCGLEEIVEGRVRVDPRLAAARPAVAAAAKDLAGDPAVADLTPDGPEGVREFLEYLLA